MHKCFKLKPSNSSYVTPTGSPPACPPNEAPPALAQQTCSDPGQDARTLTCHNLKLNLPAKIICLFIVMFSRCPKIRNYWFQKLGKLVASWFMSDSMSGFLGSPRRHSSLIELRHRKYKYWNPHSLLSIDSLHFFANQLTAWWIIDSVSFATQLVGPPHQHHLWVWSAPERSQPPDAYDEAPSSNKALLLTWYLLRF